MVLFFNLQSVERKNIFGDISKTILPIKLKMWVVTFFRRESQNFILSNQYPSRKKNSLRYKSDSLYINGNIRVLNRVLQNVVQRNLEKILHPKISAYKPVSKCFIFEIQAVMKNCKNIYFIYFFCCFYSNKIMCFTNFKNVSCWLQLK